MYMYTKQSRLYTNYIIVADFVVLLLVENIHEH